MFHKFDSASGLDEAVAAMDGAVKPGLVRAAGCSNFTAQQLTAAMEARGCTVLSNYDLAAPGIAHDLLPVCVCENIGVKWVCA